VQTSQKCGLQFGGSFSPAAGDGAGILTQMAATSPRLEELFSLERLVVREDLQQDKRAALLAVARMFDDHQVPYVVAGGIALQLYNTNVRATVDVDIVSLGDQFTRLKQAEPWGQYGFELVFDRRRFIKLRHTASNVEIDINVDPRFARLLSERVAETVDGQPIFFCSPTNLAFTKLRTQRSDWAREPVKRLQDRVDLMTILRAHPDMLERLRSDPATTDEMRRILEDICREMGAPAGDDLPPEDEFPAD